MVYVLGIAAVCTLFAVLLYVKKGKAVPGISHASRSAGHQPANHVNKAYHTGTLDVMGNSMNG
ncbi:hypothetical protein [Brevibacillus agri]|uniref:hypothetical protein n=1 Tax=Brevibacillus agri TaxID=51101 RepID=UPI0002A51056|nr:hypothetical protein [Brevibacillus agri]ELK39612.1 hypothetical protein D478_23463 [Brevibacillus agri BAB-2500]MBG9566592.1 hypothetical protein [Brevibacillus agri]